jgi:hypothetical protein
MKLTGKCKEDFEKWLYKNLYKDSNYTFEYILELFYSYTPSMQYGVYVDFFNSEEIYMSIVNDFEFIEVIVDRIIIDIPSQLYAEARTAAIEKANEIYNKQ